MPSKRAKTEEVHKPDQDDNESLNTSTSSAPLPKRTRQSIKPEPVQPQPQPEPKQSPSDRQTRHKPRVEENYYYEDLFDVICSYQDETQRYLANIFYVLPSKQDYPDYYELIKKPIDLNQIAKNILANKYKNLKQLDSDLTLMFDNAKRYNDPKSVIYKDACKLRKLTKDTCHELEQLQTRHKLLESTKTRDKKLKLLQEISEMNGDAAPVTSEPVKEPEVEDQDEETESEESSEEEEEEKTETKTPKRSKHNQKLISTMWTVFDYLKEFKLQNQSIIEPFLKLPPKRLYPDYYEEIKNPIAMNGIKKKLNKRQYKTFKDLLNDFELMFKNAMTYNLEESLIYQNAKRLLEAVKIRVKEIESQTSDIFTQKINLVSPVPIATPTRSKLTKVDSRPIKKIEFSMPKFSDVKEKMIYLYNYINDYQIDGRELAPPFRHLPSRTEYPDYYNVIKKPIDMTKIWNRINHQQNSYQSLDDMCADFALMFENACIYNEPTSTLYKDALNLQRGLFSRRDEILNELDEDEFLDDTFVLGQIKDLIQQLFDSVMTHQDLEGRILSDTFVLTYKDGTDLKTFSQIRQRLSTYTRLDQFQHDMFQVFESARLKSHKMSQLFKDSYDLQRFYIQKRDELCRNGEILLSNALNYKTTSLDSFINQKIGSNIHNLDESEALLVETEYKKLESELKSDKSNANTETKLETGGFYLINENIYCVLGQNETGSKVLVQAYLRPSDCDYFKYVKVFKNEVFKSDSYSLIDLNTTKNIRPCLVISLKDHLINEPNFGQKMTLGEDDTMLEIKSEDIFICESIYSTQNDYARKLTNKKWSPLQFIGNVNATSLVYNFTWVKRQTPANVERFYLNQSLVQTLIDSVEANLGFNFIPFKLESVQYDSLPASLKADQDEDATQSEVEDPEIMKSAKYFEQLVHQSSVFKLGDCVYIKYQQLHPNQLGDNMPLILRIDRIWTLNSQEYFIKGPVFLRPSDIPHDPTRLFLRNEVFREISRELTVGIDQVIESKKCVVMNPKKYTTSRLTNVAENDIFICETKYNLAQKTFRKFTKGLRKFELSLKSCEDEIFFMRKELVLRRHLSPLLVNLEIDYEDGSSEYLKNFNLEEEEEWNEQMKDDENSNHSMPDEVSTKTDSVGNAKKIRVKRLKKSGFNLFSREFRKSLRDTQSSLSFIDMSKEVGMRWKALSDRERQMYEERAAAEYREIEKQLKKQEAEAMLTQVPQVLSPAPVASPKPQFIVYQQQQAPTVVSQLVEPVKPVETPKQVMHKEAYIRYIANLRKMQQLNQTGAIYNPMANLSLVRSSDWYNAIDVSGQRVKEAKLQNLPSSWIENAKSNDALQNLLSLRYYLIQDAVTIEKEFHSDENNDNDDEPMETVDTIGQSDQAVTLTVL